MRKNRCIFEKTGKARYISHLDLNRVMQRAVRRADIPVWYTEGFNTHPYMTFANPLSLGFCSLYEIMECKITDDTLDFADIVTRLNKTLPEGIVISDSYEPQTKLSEICFSSYNIEFDISDETEYGKLAAAFTSDTITAVKKGKAGEREINIAPDISSFTSENCGKKMKISLILPASPEKNINPNLLLNAVFDMCETERKNALVTRTALLDADMKTFR